MKIDSALTRELKLDVVEQLGIEGRLRFIFEGLQMLLEFLQAVYRYVVVHRVSYPKSICVLSEDVLPGEFGFVFANTKPGYEGDEGEEEG